MSDTNSLVADGSLAGRRVLVTAGTGGIGFAAARALGQRGAEVVITSRRREAGNACAQRLRDESLNVECIVGDVDSSDGCAAVAEAAGHVDVLVNNAGIYPALRFFETDDAQWDQIFTVNLMASVRLCRHLVPAMQAQGWGRVIFVSSESAVSVITDMIAYSASKAAQAAFARGLAQELAGSGVTANTVLAGPTRTSGLSRVLDSVRAEMVAANGNAAPTDSEVEERFIATRKPGSLIRRLLDPREVANLIAYLATPGASGTTGAALRVDGGLAHTVYP